VAGAKVSGILRHIGSTGDAAVMPIDDFSDSMPGPPARQQPYCASSSNRRAKNALDHPPFKRTSPAAWRA